MKYPNASKGLKTIVIAEFIALAASIFAVIVSIFALPGVDASESELFTSGVVVIVTIVIYVAAYVLEIFGITAASKDEPAFKVSLFAIIAQIIFFVLSAFFYENETAYLIFSIAVDVAYFFLVHYIIHGIMHLSEHGTGKTSVCAGVGIALASSGARVLCVDCDIGLRNLDISLGLSDAGALSFLDVSEGSYALSDAAVHPDYPSLSFLTAPMNRSAEKIDGDAFRDFLRQAKKSFDFIFLDAPAGVDAAFRLVSSAADRFLLVTGSGPAAIRDAARVGELLELMGKTDVRLVVNRVDKSMLSVLKMTIDDIMDSAGLPLIGIVLEDSQVPLAAACSVPVLRFSKRCDAVAAYKNIARRLQGLKEPIRYR